MSRGQFASRVAAALIFAGLTLFVFYYLPLHIDAIASYFVPRTFIPEINSLAGAFASSTLPELGALLAVLVFVETILKGTWAFGVVLILVGGFWILYDLTLYKEGLLFANLVPSAINVGNGQQILLSESAQSELIFLFTGIIILFVISSLFTILRGARILWRKHKAYSRPEISVKPVNPQTSSL